MGKTKYGDLESPDTPSRYYFMANKWDDYLARNACLLFINHKGLDEEFENFLKDLMRLERRRKS